MTSRSRTRIKEAVLAGHPFGPGRLRERWHLGGKSGTLRASIFGVSDGLVSNLALILGVAGSGVDAQVVVIAGVAGLLAGAFSMGTGEYISMKVQREVFEHALEVEAIEIELLPDAERKELSAMFQEKGIPVTTADDVAATLMEDPERALDAHAKEELGLDPDDLGSPVGAALSSFATFSAGAFVPLAPFLIAEGTAAVVAAFAAGAVALASVGGSMAWMSHRPVWLGSGRMLVLGLGTAAITFGIGSLFGVAVG
ncbi:MAG: VIT1/CCC1 transporter family protein [Actinomycetota bacterium]